MSPFNKLPLLAVSMLLGLVWILEPAGAQTTNANFLEPQDSSSQVSLQPEIRIRTSFAIDSSSLRNATELDTLDESNGIPTLLLVSKEIWEEFPDSVQIMSTLGGTYTVENDSTLLFEPYGLSYSTEYVATIRTLRLVDGGGDTINADHDTISFTSVQPPHRLVATSLDGDSKVNCDDTILVRFSRTMDSVSASQVVSLHTRAWADSGQPETAIASTAWWNADSTVVYITSDSLPLGATCILRVEPSVITGDPLDNHDLIFYANDKFVVHLVAVSSDVNVLMPLQNYALAPDAGQSWYYSMSDTVSLQASVRVNSLVFSHWEAPALSGIHMDTSSVVRFALECDELGEYTVTAVYDPIIEDSIEVTYTTHGEVKVYDAETAQSLGGQNTYLVTRQEGLVLIAIPDSGYTFSHWQMPSADWEVSGAGNAVADSLIPLVLLSNVCASPGASKSSVRAIFIAGGAPSAPYYINATVRVSPGSDLWDLNEEDAVNMFPHNGSTDPLNWNYQSNINQEAKGITVNAVDACFEIYSVYEYRVNATGQVFFQGEVLTSPQSTFTGSYATSDPPTYMLALARRKTHTLHVEKVWEDLTGVPNTNRAILVHVDEDPDFDHVAITNGPDPEKVNSSVEDTDVYKVKCGGELLLLPRQGPGWTDDEYSFIQWRPDAGFEYGPTELELRVTSDMRVRAEYGESFLVRSISLYVDGNAITPQLFLPGEFPARNVQVFGDDGTDVVIEFNKSVDLATLTLPSGWPTLGVIENSMRIDGNPFVIYAPSNVTSALWGPNSEGESNARLTLTLKTSGIVRPILKLQKAILNITEDLKSSTGAPLENAGAFGFTTENPSVKVVFEKIWIDGDEDPFNSGEIFSLYALSRTTTFGTTSDTGKIPVVGTESMSSGSSHVYNTNLGAASDLADVDWVSLGIATWDEDEGNGIFENIGQALQGIGGALSGYTVPSGTLPPLMHPFNAGTILKIAGALLQSGLFANVDDRIGYHDWLYGRTEWWGGHPSVADQLQVDVGKVRYRIRIELE